VLECFIASIDSDFASHDYGALDVNWNNDRILFSGVKLSSLGVIRRNTLKLRWAYPNSLPDHIAVGLNMNYGNACKSVSIIANTWTKIGYVLGVGQKCNIEITSAANYITADFDLYTKSYVARSKTHTQLQGTQSNTLELGIGTGINSGVGNVQWFPVYIRNDVGGTVIIKASGSNPFLFNYGVTATSDTPDKTYEFDNLT
jgi:hypothetical protein